MGARFFSSKYTQTCYVTQQLISGSVSALTAVQIPVPEVSQPLSDSCKVGRHRWLSLKKGGYPERGHVHWNGGEGILSVAMHRGVGVS